MNKFALSAVVVAAGIVATPFAFAQTAVPHGAGPGGAATPSHRAHSLPSERIEARLAYAKTTLKITPQQESQWNALADVLRRHATAMDQQMTQRRGIHRDNHDQPVSAIERLTRRQEMMTQAASHMNEVLEAAKPLYAVLNDEQKKEADALLSRDGGPQRGHHRPRSH